MSWGHLVQFLMYSQKGHFSPILFELMPMDKYSQFSLFIEGMRSFWILKAGRKQLQDMPYPIIFTNCIFVNIISFWRKKIILKRPIGEIRDSTIPFVWSKTTVNCIWVGGAVQWWTFILLIMGHFFLCPWLFGLIKMGQLIRVFHNL